MDMVWFPDGGMGRRVRALVARLNFTIRVVAIPGIAGDNFASGRVALWRVTKDGVNGIMRRRVKPRFWVLMIVVTAVVFLSSFAVMQLRFNQGAARLAQAESERDALALQARTLSDQLEFAATDDYVIKVARDELNMIMPDEVRYVNGAH